MVSAGAAPLFGQYVDPRLEQPYTKQTNAGWSHELMPNTVRHRSTTSARSATT